MTPSRPYIMRALYEWIVDNECTPYVLVDASMADVMVPRQFVKDNQIVLNISPDAVVDLTRVPQPTGLAAALAGETWHYQAWYRDSNPTATNNFTDAVSVSYR